MAHINAALTMSINLKWSLAVSCLIVVFLACVFTNREEVAQLNIGMPRSFRDFCKEDFVESFSGVNQVSSSAWKGYHFSVSLAKRDSFYSYLRSKNWTYPNSQEMKDLRELKINWDGYKPTAFRCYEDGKDKCFIGYGDDETGLVNLVWLSPRF